MTRKATLPDLAWSIVEAAADAGCLDRTYRVRPSHANEMQDVALTVLRPRFPEDTTIRLDLPTYRESVRQYACRVVNTTAHRARRRGGLRRVRPSTKACLIVRDNAIWPDTEVDHG